MAKHLNISIGTVSRALNGRADVSEETRKRVLEAAKRLGYSPNQSGRSLRRGSTGMVGFMVIANRSRAVRGEAFFMTVFDGVQSVLAKENLDLVIYYCGDGQSPETYVQRIVERGLVDGLIVSQTTRVDHRIDYLIQQNLPFIAFGRSQSGGDHSWIDLDFEGVAEQSIDLLTRLGHRRIAVATPAGDVNYGFVYTEACRAALKRRGLELDDDLVIREAISEAGGYRVGERLLAMKQRPTGVVAVENSLAIGLYSKLKDAGVAPGRDISVVGFDETPTFGLFLQPPLTRFRLELVDLGRWLGTHMVELIEAKRAGKTIPFAQKVWPLELVVGASTMPVSPAADGAPEVVSAEAGAKRRVSRTARTSSLLAGSTARD
ncbi:MAG: LacI family DNA-binding transcriptional regulator [Ancalomicrobiaceae bacterium]|nr:LacI family DNA-binding transcriptional regulator [Ancalomicrobiaceae bacterium]